MLLKEMPTGAGKLQRAEGIPALVIIAQRGYRGNGFFARVAVRAVEDGEILGRPENGTAGMTVEVGGDGNAFAGAQVVL